MGTSESVAKRREQVFQLLLQGVKPEDLANQLSVSISTIDKDFKFIRKEKAKRHTKLTLSERLMEYDESARQRLARIWTIIADKTATKKEITNALRLLQTEEELKFKRDQMSGILPKSDVSLNFNQFNLNNAESIRIEFQEMVELPKQDEIKVIDVKQAEDNKEDKQ